MAVSGLAADGSTPERILAAAKESLLEVGYAALSTRGIAQRAGVPLSQIHYHFGSKRQLILALLESENERLLRRQTELYDDEGPLWKQWEQACDFLDDDLASGYVRVLQEMTAVGWSDAEVAEAVRAFLRGWFHLLTRVATRFAHATGGWGPLDPQQVATLAGTAFLGGEAMILLGFNEDEVPVRAALRQVGAVIRSAEERAR